MARTPVRITDESTDTVEVRDTLPSSTAMGLVVRVASQAAAIESLATTAAVTNVASSTTSGTLLATNVDRHSFYVHNDSNAVLFVKFGTGASATSYTVELIAGAFERFEYPSYTGAVSGIWETANGFARLTEVT